MLQYWWIPAVIAWYIFQAYSGIQNNIHKTSGWFIVVFLTNMCPLWAIVSRYSKNLIFDGLLYDNIIVLSFIAVMLYFNQQPSWTSLNYIGLGMVAVGFLFMKL